jgi:hypothetical protein
MKYTLRVQYLFSQYKNKWSPTPQQPPVGQSLIIFKASWSHSGTPHSIGLFWTSDHLDADICTRKHTSTRDISVPPARLEPAIPASERPQTHALDRAATGIGKSTRKVNKITTSV